jgi:hypothetical protein
MFFSETRPIQSLHFNTRSLVIVPWFPVRRITRIRPQPLPLPLHSSTKFSSQVPTSSPTILPPLDHPTTHLLTVFAVFIFATFFESFIHYKRLLSEEIKSRWCSRLSRRSHRDYDCS